MFINEELITDGGIIRPSTFCSSISFSILLPVCMATFVRIKLYPFSWAIRSIANKLLLKNIFENASSLLTSTAMPIALLLPFARLRAALFG